jgi:hypothetical protein
MLIRLFCVCCLMLLVSCAGSGTLVNQQSSETQLTVLAEKQGGDLESMGALLRVKVVRAGKIDDFRAELFSGGDSLMSIYVRGFLGKSVLKATLVEDSLTVFFPDDGYYYVGHRDDLQAGGFADAGHIIDHFLTIFSGQVPVPGSQAWDYYCYQRKNSLKLIADDKRFNCNITTQFRTGDSFPWVELSSLDLKNRDNQLRIHIETQTVKWNRLIPAAKFDISPPEGSLRLTKEELGDLLADLS